MPNTTEQAEITLRVEGMSCASCVAHVQKAAARTPGVSSANVNLANGRAVVNFDPTRTDPSTIASAITHAGYPAFPQSDQPAHENAAHEHHQHQHAAQWFRRAVAGFILWLPLEIIHWILHIAGHHSPPAIIWAAFITSTIAIVYIGELFYRSAWRAALRRTANMDTLIALGASVAYLYSLVGFAGYYLGAWSQLPALYFMDATGLLALISLGHYLESRARGSAGSAVRKLLELAPAVALKIAHTDQPSIEHSGLDAQSVPLTEINIGDHILVRPGDRVPIDGIVIDGASSVDQSMLTGESIPVSRKIGDEVFGGTQNINGRLIVRVTSTGQQTALSQIIKLVENAQSAKPPVQLLADRIAAIFVPTVLGIALLTGVGWYLWAAAHGWTTWQTWAAIANAVCSVLIIACPCALGLALPTAIMVGLGIGARRGILIRDIDTLQNAERIDTVILDKTGTLTVGRPQVESVISADGMPPDEILKLAAAAEEYSEHPLARAVVAEARRRQLQWAPAGEFTNQPGQGVIARVGEKQIAVGSNEFIVSLAKDLADVAIASETYSPSPGTPSVSSVAKPMIQSSDDSIIQSDPAIHIAHLNDRVIPLGQIVLSDQLKSDSAAGVAMLNNMGLTALLVTGDNHATAQRIAQQAGITDIRAGVRPAGKATIVCELQSAGKKVAMVGDGINDAPALAQADLGIAMGSGSDIARETGGIVLTNASVTAVPVAIRLSRLTMRTIRQNLFFAFIYNILAIPLAAFGLLNPLIAAAAMALSDLTVIGNALRMRLRKID